MDYQPQPIPTADVRLSPEVLALTEKLAENTHEIWARQRLAEGWRYGPRRDDAAKEHPNLVPYAQLSESDKDYDRGTSLETIKVLHALGYRLERAAPPAGGGTGVAPPRADRPPGPTAGPSEPADDLLLPWDPSAEEGDDLLPPETAPDAAPRREEVRRQAAARHQAMQQRVTMFNEDAADLVRRHPELVERSRRDLLSDVEEKGLPPAAKAVLGRYAVADRLAIQYGAKVRGAFRDLFVMAFLAMAAFELAGEEFPAGVRLALVVLYGLVWLLAYLRWRVARGGDCQNRHLDYRALAEGLRVEFFWRLAGIDDRVQEHYLGRQRNELEWIRYALRTWRARDDRRFPLAGSADGAALDVVRAQWAAKQLAYFTKAAPDEEHKEHACRRDAKASLTVNFLAVVAVAGVLLVSLRPAAGDAASAAAEHGWLHTATEVLFLVGNLTVVFAALRIAYAEKLAFAEHAKRYAGARDRFAEAVSRLDRGAPRRDEYRKLGQEALWENGDWLLAHRERPLEVPIP